jgi:hypothetical protein
LKLASLRPHLALWGLRGAWALAVALWVVALVPWFRTPAPSPLTPDAAQRSVAAAVSQPQRVAEPESDAPSAPAQAAPVRAASAPEVAAVPERVAREGAVCGLTDGGGSSDAPSASQRAGHLARQAALGLQQAFEALRSRGEVPAQAAAWWLRVLVAREAADAQPAQQPCAPGADCGPTAVAAQGPTPAAAVDALAQLAQASNDAWVQQVAQRACEGATPPSGQCASLGTRRWSALEPDNAAAWLQLAALEPQAPDEALHGIARSSRFEPHRGRLAAWVLQASSDAWPTMQRYAAWQRSDELERASDARALVAAARACSDSARRDTNRDQLCERAARWLAHGTRPLQAAEAASARALDCPTIERQWREARDGALRGTRVATGGPAGARP